MAVNVKDEVIKAGIAMIASSLGAAASALATAAITKRYARDERIRDVAKAKALIQKLETVPDLSTGQAQKLEKAMRTVLIDDVDKIKESVIAAIIISACKDKDRAICDVEHRLTVRGPVTRGTLDAQKQWLYDEVEGLNRAYGISVAVVTSI